MDFSLMKCSPAGARDSPLLHNMLTGSEIQPASHPTGTGLQRPLCEINHSLQLVPYDAVNRNKVSIRQLVLIFLLSHYMFRPLWAIFR
jgi:hypothetical protein